MNDPEFCNEADESSITRGVLLGEASIVSIERVHPLRDRWLFRCGGQIIRYATGGVVYAETAREADRIRSLLAETPGFRPAQRSEDDRGSISVAASSIHVAQG